MSIDVVRDNRDKPYHYYYVGIYADCLTLILFEGKFVMLNGVYSEKEIGVLLPKEYPYGVVFYYNLREAGILYTTNK